MMPSLLKRRLLLLSLLVVAIDQWSKWLVELHLPRFVAQTVIPGLLNFTHVENTGVAFGLFASAGKQGGAWILVALGIAALVMVGVYFGRTPDSNRLLLTALALVMGGAVGNLIDRISAGAVTDFIDFYFRGYHWHTFNVADSAITIGIVLIGWESFRPRRQMESDGSADVAAVDPPPRSAT